MLVDVPSEIHSLFLEFFSVIELLRKARVSKGYRSIIATILRERDREQPVMWRAAVPPRLRSWSPPPSGAPGGAAWREMLEPLPVCRTRASFSRELLRPALLRALDGATFIPELAIIYYTEACWPAHAAAKAAKITREVAADAARWLPVSTTLVVVRATGVLASGLCGGHVNEPLTVEEEEEPMLVVQLARLPGVRLQWYAHGDASGTCSQRRKDHDSFISALKVTGDAERHAEEWWRAQHPTLNATPLDGDNHPGQCAECGFTRSERDEPPMRECPWCRLSLRHASGGHTAATYDRSVERSLASYWHQSGVGAELVLDRWLEAWFGSGDGTRWVLGFVADLYNGSLQPSFASQACHKTRFYAGGIAISVAFKPPGRLPEASLGAPPSQWDSGGIADTHGAVWSPGALHLCLSSRLSSYLGSSTSSVAMCSVLEQAGAGSTVISEALRSCLSRTRLPDGLDWPGHYRAVAWNHSVCPSEIVRPPLGGVVFTCNGRGAAFHEEQHAESRALHASLPGCVIAGFFSAGEFGPMLLSYDHDAEENSRGESHVNDVIQGRSALAKSAMTHYACVVAMFG